MGSNMLTGFNPIVSSRFSEYFVNLQTHGITEFLTILHAMQKPLANIMKLIYSRWVLTVKLKMISKIGWYSFYKVNSLRFGF